VEQFGEDAGLLLGIGLTVHLRNVVAKAAGLRRLKNMCQETTELRLWNLRRHLLKMLGSVLLRGIGGGILIQHSSQLIEDAHAGKTAQSRRQCAHRCCRGRRRYFRAFTFLCLEDAMSALQNSYFRN